MLVENENSKHSPEERRPVKSGGWFGAWHFLIIFLVIAALVGVGYYCSYNRKKVLYSLLMCPVIFFIRLLLGLDCLVSRDISVGWFYCVFICADF